VEFYGSGLSTLSVPTARRLPTWPRVWRNDGLLPVDAETLAYLQFTGAFGGTDRSGRSLLQRADAFSHGSDSPRRFLTTPLELDLGTVEPTVAGPKRPQDRVALRQAKSSFTKVVEGTPAKHVSVRNNGDSFDLSSGAVVIAAITSCHNTSNPRLCWARACWPKKAVERGLHVKPWSDKSCARFESGTDYLLAAGLTPYLEKLNFTWSVRLHHLYWHSGPLPDAIGPRSRTTI